MLPLILLPLALACQNQASQSLIIQRLQQLSESPTTRDSFVAGSLRLAFHDAGSYWAQDQSGGPTGCIDLSDPDNAGLPRVIDLLQPLYLEFQHLCPSRADFWALAGAVAVDVASEGRTQLAQSMTWGRRSEDSCVYKVGRLPNHQLGLDHVQDIFMDRLQLNPVQVMALMGAHTLGRGHREFSGFDKSWDATPDKFDNEYFKDVLAMGTSNWARAGLVGTSHKFWVDPATVAQATGQQTMMLNTDMALVWDFGTNDVTTPETLATSCQIKWPAQFKDLVQTDDWRVIAPTAHEVSCPKAETPFRKVAEDFARDEKLFLKEFGKAYRVLMALGYGNSLCPPCPGNQPCFCATVGRPVPYPGYPQSYPMPRPHPVPGYPQRPPVVPHGHFPQHPVPFHVPQHPPMVPFHGPPQHHPMPFHVPAQYPPHQALRQTFPPAGKPVSPPRPATQKPTPAAVPVSMPVGGGVMMAAMGGVSAAKGMFSGVLGMFGVGK